jgi:hypothetical protein
MWDFIRVIQVARRVFLVVRMNLSIEDFVVYFGREKAIYKRDD